LRVPWVYGLKKSYFFFFFAAFFAGALAFFLVAIVSILPFPSEMDHCDIKSSQFVLCILFQKKIVKKKTHIELRISVTHFARRVMLFA
jgi:hypothetical protein